jgi:hypothetical protein
MHNVINASWGVSETKFADGQTALPITSSFGAHRPRIYNVLMRGTKSQNKAFVKQPCSGLEQRLHFPCQAVPAAYTSSVASPSLNKMSYLSACPFARLFTEITQITSKLYSVQHLH